MRSEYSIRLEKAMRDYGEGKGLTQGRLAFQVAKLLGSKFTQQNVSYLLDRSGKNDVKGSAHNVEIAQVLQVSERWLSKGIEPQNLSVARRQWSLPYAIGAGEPSSEIQVEEPKTDYIPGAGQSVAEVSVLSTMRDMKGKVSPRTDQTLRRLLDLARNGTLSDDDWETLERIANGLSKTAKGTSETNT